MIRSTLRSSICHARQVRASREPAAGAAAWSRRPIRSRRLLPEAPDPDGHSQPASQLRPDEDHLPTCFQPVPASIDVDAELRRTGGYFHAPLRATLLNSVTPTSAATPNYRFTPDEEGGIVDMVLKKKGDIPAPFKHVRHQRLQPHLAPGSWFPLEAADLGAEAGGASLDPFTPYSPGEDALEGEAVEALGVGLEPDAMSVTISGGEGMAGAAEGQSGAQTQPHRRRGSFLAAAAEEPADVNPSGLSAELDSYLDDVLHTAKHYPDGAVGAPARSGATSRQMPSSQGREQAQRMTGTEGAEGAVALRMFGYCIGYQEMFHALWDLDLLHQHQRSQRRGTEDLPAASPVCMVVKRLAAEGNYLGCLALGVVAAAHPVTLLSTEATKEGAPRQGHHHHQYMAPAHCPQGSAPSCLANAWRSLPALVWRGYIMRVATTTTAAYIKPEPMTEAPLQGGRCGKGCHGCRVQVIQLYRGELSPEGLTSKSATRKRVRL
ncbi:hypothetical protein HaLaN_08865 [Haematococcus lacustris]|uniref:Uncharacterized protein n=1 Tax=Haematococcus lacustris TaxID=44745 RepID=A0A699YTC0_HAELA|nr:hypothetical protein HaLaN_08865 [Haematococcus lacustris]